MTPRLIEALAVVALGVLLVKRQQLFVTPRGTDEQIGRRRGDFRKLGYLLIASGVLLALAATTRS